MEHQDRGGNDRVVLSHGVTWDGWKTDGPLAVAVVMGAMSVAASLWVHGWARLGLQVLGGVLMLPLLVTLVFLTLGAALAGLFNATPSVLERVALVAFSVGLGAWLGSYTPGAPQDLFITPVGFLGAGFLLRSERFRQARTRRRVAACIALIAAAAGATGLWLLAQ